MAKRKFFVDWFVDLVVNIRFFSRLPLPKAIPKDGIWGTPSFSDSLLNLPLIGFIIALPAVFLLIILTFTKLPPLVIATLVIITICLLTGGLHEDGLADSADGLFGGNSPTNRLTIMKDSRIGSYGVIALILSFSIRIFLFSELLIEFNNFLCSFVLIGAVTTSRAAMLTPWVFLKPARNNGLSSKFGAPNFLSFVFVNLYTFIINIPLIFYFSFTAFALAFIMSLWVSFWVCFVANKRIKGRTGDILGATQQFAEIAFLIGYLHI